MFLYYLPSAGPSTTLAEIAALGLAHAVAEPWSLRGVSAGPDGSPGSIACFGRDSAGDIGYWPDKQTWRPLAVVEEASCLFSGTKRQDAASTLRPWIGLLRDCRPCPAELARPEQLAGEWVRLFDGADWLCPIARGWIEEEGELRWLHRLPAPLELDDAGKWTRGATPARFAALWDLALRWDEARDAAILASVEAASCRFPDKRQDASSTVVFEFDDLVDSAVVCLAQNYRIGRTEAAMLGILTPALARAVLDVLTDYGTRLDWLQKKTADTSPIPAGGALNGSAGGPV
jgi:hypothetical protein